MRECNVLRKFKYFEVNFIVWIIIQRIFKMMEIMKYFVQVKFKEFQMTPKS